MSQEAARLRAYLRKLVKNLVKDIVPQDFPGGIYRRPLRSF